MKCLFAMKFYSLIWHINEAAFGFRRQTRRKLQMVKMLLHP